MVTFLRNRTRLMLVLAMGVSAHEPISGQWSTSTLAQNGLFACDGFNQDLKTSRDGSSLVSGTLSSYVFLQKLDSLGYPVWGSPVMAMYNDSADIYNSQAGIYDDGNGGAFLLWGDHREAIPGANGHLNFALYGQHVGRDGNVLWPLRGVEIIPASRFPAGSLVLADGRGGLLLLHVDEVDSGFPSTYFTRMSVLRMNPQGELDWEVPIDSATSQAFTPVSVELAGEDMLVSLWRRGRYETLVFDTSTTARHFEAGSSSFGHTSLGKLIRANFFNADSIVMYQYNNSGEIEWRSSLQPPPGSIGTAPFRPSAELVLPDQYGGCFLLYCMDDTVYHLDSLGRTSRSVFPTLSSMGGLYPFSDGQGGIVAISDTCFIAQRWDGEGQALWPPSFRVITDKENLYSPLFKADNNGGILFAYWTTLGGIRVQHTGRTGRVGMLAGVQGEGALPLEFTVYQNFPNPFNGITKVPIDLPSRRDVGFTVYDILGREVKREEIRTFEAGRHSLRIEMPTGSSGVYFCKISIGSQVKTLRMLMLK